MNHNRGALSPLVANSLLVVAAVVGSLLLCELLLRGRHLRRRTERHQRHKGEDTEDELGLRDEVQLPPSTPEWTEAWRVTEGVLVLMRDECRKHETPFGVVTLTRNIQVSPDKQKKEEFLRRLGATDMFYPERRIADLGKREGIPVLNLAPPWRRRRRSGRSTSTASTTRWESDTGTWRGTGRPASLSRRGWPPSSRTGQ